MNKFTRLKLRKDSKDTPIRPKVKVKPIKTQIEIINVNVKFNQTIKKVVQMLNTPQGMKNAIKDYIMHRVGLLSSTSDRDLG